MVCCVVEDKWQEQQLVHANAFLNIPLKYGVHTKKGVSVYGHMRFWSPDPRHRLTPKLRTERDEHPNSSHASPCGKGECTVIHMEWFSDVISVDPKDDIHMVFVLS